MNPIGLTALLCSALIITGCGTRMAPLDYRSQHPYVPLTLDPVSYTHLTLPTIYSV